MALPGPEREKVPIVERPTTPEIPPELEKVEAVLGAEISLPQPVTDDQGQVIVDTPAPQQVTVILPLTEEEISKKLPLKIVDSLFWLREWAKRLLKIVGGKFIYKLKV
jgi:hypothetical protein